jgi:prepilin-type N-terminal cleavage/methylation domain-containing protein
LGRRNPRFARPRRADEGFSLTEVIVVVVVLGFLLTIVVVTVHGVREDASTSTCAAERRVIEQAVSAWPHDDTGPPTMNGLVDAGILREASRRFTVSGAGDVVAAAAECAAAATNGSGSGKGAPPSHGGAATSIDVHSIQDLEVTLAWTGNVDADIWVESPTGEFVGWNSPAAAGGWLDLDVVPATPQEMGPHVERVLWPAGAAPVGTYAAWARFESNGWGAQDVASYTLTIRVGDTILASEHGAVGLQGTASAPLSTLLAA